MTIEEIRRNAPSTTSHYTVSWFSGVEKIIYIKYRLGYCCIHDSVKWITSFGAKGESFFELSHRIKPI